MTASERMIEEAARWSARNYAPLGVVLTRGEGAFVWDVDGRRYVDMLSAYSALNQGHCHPRIVAAMVEQAGRLALTSRAFYNDRLGPFLARLCGLTGFERALPMNSGAEAVETAVKLMRRYGYERRGIPDDRAEIIVAKKNFHGRTTTMVSLSTDPTSYGHYGPPTPGFVKVPYDDVDALSAAINENTAGVLLEPIQGEAGVIIPRDTYLPAVREVCDKKGVLLCLDEVQTGFGRTGRLFAWHHTNTRPDVIVLGKALSGGMYPVSAICADARVIDVFTPGTHGSTYGGNPLAAAVGLAALDVLVDEGLADRAARLGAMALEKLRKGLAGAAAVKEVRGRGMMIAVEYKGPYAHDVVEALARDTSVLAKDAHETIVRFAPPLVIADDVFEDALTRMLPVLASPVI
ncbi:MAG: ornithine--oxo-acid transaminase [Polyangiales bacterium]